MTTPFKLRGWPGYQNSPMEDTDPHTGKNPDHKDHGEGGVPIPIETETITKTKEKVTKKESKKKETEGKVDPNAAIKAKMAELTKELKNPKTTVLRIHRIRAEIQRLEKQWKE